MKMNKNQTEIAYTSTTTYTFSFPFNYTFIYLYRNGNLMSVNELQKEAAIARQVNQIKSGTFSRKGRGVGAVCTYSRVITMTAFQPLIFNQCKSL